MQKRSASGLFQRRGRKTILPALAHVRSGSLRGRYLAHDWGDARMPPHTFTPSIAELSNGMQGTTGVFLF